MRRLPQVFVSLCAGCLVHGAELRLGGKFEADAIYVKGPHLKLKIGWEEYYWCKVRRIIMVDSLGRQETFDYPVQPLRVQSSEALPIVHWMEYIVNLDYECALKDAKRHFKVPPFPGEPLALLGAKFLTYGNATAVNATLPPELLNVNYSIYILAILRQEGEDETIAMEYHWKEPIILGGLIPGIAYTVSLSVDIGGFSSKRITLDLITGVPEGLSKVDEIRVLSRTRTKVTLRWEYLKKKSLLKFIEEFSVDWRSRRSDEKLGRAITRQWSFTIDGLEDLAEYKVSVTAYFRCGDRLVRGAPEYHVVGAHHGHPGPEDPLATVGPLAFIAFVLMIIPILTFCILRSKYRERIRRQREEFLVRLCRRPRGKTVSARVRTANEAQNTGPQIEATRF